ncbi:hypothetical protein ACWC2K_37145 [Streptomyces chattanoogensis]
MTQDRTPRRGGGQKAVTRRRRDRSGTWWYDVQVDIPDRQDDRRHGPALIRRTIEFCAPYPVVQPVEGERYDVLDPPPPEERQRWLLAMSPHQDGWADFPLHRLDCAQAQGSERLLTDQ